MDEEHFYKNKANGIDGLQPNCIVHLKEITFNWQIQNPEIYKKKMHQRNINPSMKTKQYWKEKEKKRRKDGKILEWQRNNKDKIKQYNKKRTEKKHEITKQEWIDCKNYFNNCCAYCGISEVEAKKQQGQNLHKEHVIDCGRNDLKNCVPSCKSCNSEKHLTSLNDWYNVKNPKYTKDKYLKIYQWLRYDYKKYIKKKKKNKLKTI